jgi:hypothetical protein
MGWPGFDPHRVNSIKLPNGTFTVKDQVHGYVRYNTLTPLAHDGSAGLGSGSTDILYSSPVFANSIGASFSQSGYVYTPAPSEGSSIQIANSPSRGGSDYVLISSGHFTPDQSENMELALGDDTGRALSSGKIPARLFGLENFNYAALLYNYKGNHLEVIIQSELTSLTRVTAVPEPGTYAMLLAGLSFIAWKRRHRNKPRG